MVIVKKHNDTKNGIDEDGIRRAILLYRGLISIACNSRASKAVKEDGMQSNRLRAGRQ